MTNFNDKKSDSNENKYKPDDNLKYLSSLSKQLEALSISSKQLEAFSVLSEEFRALGSLSERFKLDNSLISLGECFKLDDSLLESLKNLRLSIDLSSTLRESKRDPKEIQLRNLKKLKKSYQKQNLVFVLGSGVSINYGLPDWKTLLQRLLIKTLESEQAEYKDSKKIADLFNYTFSPDNLILARNIRLYCKDSSEELVFENLVRESIYDELKNIETDELFKEIQQFCMPFTKDGNIDSIITFNYDDILEKCLEEINKNIKTIYNANIQSEDGVLPIYHVHGFLPRKSTQEKLGVHNKIIFSEDIYHQLYTDIYCWNNIVQINKFTNNVCLFIGISLTDPNLRRLLDVAKNIRGEKSVPHYLFKKKHDKQKIKNIISIINKIDRAISEKKDEETNILGTINAIKILLQINEEIINPKEGNDDFTEEVDTLINIMERFEKDDALSLGVNIIWVNDYKEIPILLNQIRHISS